MAGILKLRFLCKVWLTPMLCSSLSTAPSILSWNPLDPQSDAEDKFLVADHKKFSRATVEDRWSDLLLERRKIVMLFRQRLRALSYKPLLILSKATLKWVSGSLACQALCSSWEVYVTITKAPPKQFYMARLRYSIRLIEHHTRTTTLHLTTRKQLSWLASQTLDTKFGRIKRHNSWISEICSIEMKAKNINPHFHTNCVCQEPRLCRLNADSSFYAHVVVYNHTFLLSPCKDRAHWNPEVLVNEEYGSPFQRQFKTSVGTIFERSFVLERRHQKINSSKVVYLLEFR